MRTIGYLIPEFPGQTHVWMWREIAHLREWGLPVRIYSTRPPPDRDRARHAFAADAEREAVFLWPRRLTEVAGAVAWAMFTRPVALLKCVGLGFSLPVNTGPAWRTVLPLVVPACVLARDAAKEGVGRLHCQSAKGCAILGMMVRRLIGVPYSVVINANPDWWGGAMHEKLGESDLIVTHSTWILEQIRHDYPEIEPGRVLRAPVGVDTRRWLPRGNESAGAPRPFRVVTVGRLHPNKQHDLVIRAVAALAAAGRDVVLRIVGGGPDEARLRAIVEELGVAERVTLVGSVSEDRVLDEVRQADAFVMACAEEGLGVVFIEAMSCGLPAVGPRSGGVQEIISSGENGLLVEPGSVGAFADAIGSVMDDPGLRDRLGREARRSIVERFDSRLGARTLFERLSGAAPAESPAQFAAAT